MHVCLHWDKVIALLNPIVLHKNMSLRLTILTLSRKKHLSKVLVLLSPGSGLCAFSLHSAEAVKGNVVCGTGSNKMQ